MDPQTGTNAVDASAAPATAGQRLMARLADTIKAIPRKFLTWFAVALVVIYVVQRWRAPSIILVPIALPSRIAESGVSSRELTERLLDHINRLREDARPTVSQSGWVIETDILYPDVAIPGIKMTLPQVISFLEGAFGRRTKRVSWQLSARPKSLELSSDNWIVTASVNGQHLRQAPFRFDSPDSALERIASAVLEDADPYTAIRMLRFSGRCDEARSLAARQMRKARSNDERVVASNVMGFVSECGFEMSGANTHDAELFYKKAVQADSMNPQPHANLGRLFAERSDTMAARAEFERAARLGPDLAATFESWGYALMLAGDDSNAVKKLEESIRLDPENPTAQINLGFAYLNLGDTALAIGRLGSGVSMRPDIAALKEYGHVLIARRSWSGAADAFRRAWQLDTTDVDTKYWLAFALDAADRRAASQALFLTIAKQSSETSLYCAGARKYLPSGTACGK